MVENQATLQDISEYSWDGCRLAQMLKTQRQRTQMQRTQVQRTQMQRSQVGARPAVALHCMKATRTGLLLPTEFRSLCVCALYGGLARDGALTAAMPAPPSCCQQPPRL